MNETQEKKLMLTIAKFFNEKTFKSTEKKTTVFHLDKPMMYDLHQDIVAFIHKEFSTDR